MSILGAKRTFVLTNGYDPDDYSVNYLNYDKKPNNFTIGYFGLYNTLRDHSFFWETIKEISKINSAFSNHLHFLFAGEVHDQFFSNMKHYEFDKKLDYYDYLNHADSIKNMMNCDLLLVTQGNTKSVAGRLPAKLFEYLGARRPILAIGKKK